MFKETKDGQTYSCIHKTINPSGICDECLNKDDQLGYFTKNNMTISEKKEIVRSVIINAVPNFPSHISVWNKNDKTTEIDVISSRPIQLQDVLVAIGKKKENNDDYNPILVSEGGSFYRHDMDSSDIEGYELEHLAHWDLSQDFDHQSEEVWLFLHGLLCE